MNDFLSGAFGVVTRASKDGNEFAIKTLKCVRLQEIGFYFRETKIVEMFSKIVC